jgi:hypothetical protein
MTLTECQNMAPQKEMKGKLGSTKIYQAAYITQIQTKIVKVIFGMEVVRTHTEH